MLHEEANRTLFFCLGLHIANHPPDGQTRQPYIEHNSDDQERPHTHPPSAITTNQLIKGNGLRVNATATT